jgi:hypothetical protein
MPRKITFFDVSHCKEVPLAVVLGVEVEIQIEVVLQVSYLLHLPEAARIEIGVEEQVRAADVLENYWWTLELLFSLHLLVVD